MDVYVFDQQKDLALTHTAVQAIVSQVVSSEDKQYDEVSIHFVDSKKISELHNQFFNDPLPTDCISFPIDGADEEGYRVLGDVFVCPEIAIDYANKRGKDPYSETTLYIVHGLLHLMGYDDLCEEDRKKMRKAERRHLSILKKLGLLLHR